MAANIIINTANLNLFIGKTVEDICPLGFGKIGDSHNHCAHFVSHVLKLNASLHIGLTCAVMVANGNKHSAAGACIRVNEVFNVCDDLGEPDENGCLVYYTLPGNMHKDGTMGDMSQKHIGIYSGGMVWNYGNTHDKVRRDMVSNLKHLYGTNTIILYTAFPAGATVLTLDQIKALAK
jgi:hypothetical protein